MIRLVPLICWLACGALPLAIAGCQSPSSSELDRRAFADTIRESIHADLLSPWYPRAIDSTHGGYRSHFARDWVPLDPQRKFLVAQAWHLWTTARIHAVAPRDDSLYWQMARHGARFLRNEMWDAEEGVFYSLVDRTGEVIRRDDSFTATKTASATHLPSTGSRPITPLPPTPAPAV